MHSVKIFDEDGKEILSYSYESADDAYESFLAFSRVFENYLLKGRHITLCRFKGNSMMHCAKFDGVA